MSEAGSGERERRLRHRRLVGGAGLGQRLDQRLEVIGEQPARDPVEDQLKHLGLAPTTTINITPMIGQNEAYGAQGTDGVQEFFSLNDAKRREHWAEGKSWVSGLGEWALPCDRAGMKESGPTSPNDLGPEHSGEQQHDWQYS